MEYTYADVRQATQLLVKTNGRESAVDLLACYGCERAFKLSPEDWGNYIDDAHRLIEYGAQIVPRGVPVEDKPAESELPELVRHFLQREPTPQPTTERTRPALDWNKPKPFDAFGGFFTEPADMADWQDTYYPR
jgi:hypothetical protein